jgi:hypothetical protein
MFLSDIIFYVYLLMVLPLLAYTRERLLNWLWWYPPNWRGMRNFRLRRFIGSCIVWFAMVTPIVIIYERNRRSLPIFGVQRAMTSGASSVIFKAGPTLGWRAGATRD